MSEPTLSRRALFRTAAGAAAAATVGRPAAAQGDGYDGWFDDVSNYEGTYDYRGEDEVTVRVGAEGNDGAFAFEPAAVLVDPGATVVWEWTGEGGGHNVAAEDGAYESEIVEEAGATFEHTFEGEGVSRYVCTPHESLGMKGAVAVGTEVGEVVDPEEAGGDGGGDGDAGGGDAGDGEEDTPDVAGGNPGEGEGAGEEGAVGQPEGFSEGAFPGAQLIAAAMVAAFLSPLLFVLVLKRVYDPTEGADSGPR